MVVRRWMEALKDMASDFRVGTSALAGARFAVYGLGSAVYVWESGPEQQDKRNDAHRLPVWALTAIGGCPCLD